MVIRKKPKSSFNKLSTIEHEIDELRRMIFEELTRGSLRSKDREDIMHLVKRLDQMADHVKDASRAVILLLEANRSKGNVETVCPKPPKSLVDCATTLRKAIEKLGMNPEKAMDLSKTN